MLDHSDFPLNTKDVAERLDIKRSEVFKMVTTGELPRPHLVNGEPCWLIRQLEERGL